MREIVIVSGKGGTGKTSITAALACLAEHPVVVDCDVDAANLGLLLSPTIGETHAFHGGKTAHLHAARCTGCGACADACHFEAIRADGESGHWHIDPMACEGCAVCVQVCPAGAITMEPSLDGHWYRSSTRVGSMLHARLGVGAENSGKLVALLRREARAMATVEKAPWILVDGPPGIGCPVIACLTGADHVLAVTEPTVSGIHDLERLLELASHFDLPVSVLINKADLNPGVGHEIMKMAERCGADVLGEIPYDPVFTVAQVAGMSVVEFPNSAAPLLCGLWSRLRESLGSYQ